MEIILSSWGSQRDQDKPVALIVVVSWLVLLHIQEVLDSHLNLETEKPDRFLQFLETHL
jgi:hypothetical protein